MTAHDPALLRALSVHETTLPALAGAAAADHVAVQESTLAALLDGAYEGNLTVAELLRHGDHGIGTLNGLDGELIIIDGRAWRAGADGSVDPVRGDARTPFAVATRLSDAAAFDIERPLAYEELLAWLDDRLPPGASADVVRIDGRFGRVHARSVPRQRPPYKTLAQVAEQQVDWTWRDLDATVVGFRFDASTAGVDAVGHHLHVLSADRTRGGHVLACDLTWGSVRIERLDELRVALPVGVALTDPGQFDAEEAVRRIERERPQSG